MEERRHRSSRPKKKSDRLGSPQPSLSLPSNRKNAVQHKPPPPITKRGQATRERLLQAMRELLQERAFHEIRLEDITRQAGVRVSLFYHYFQSKIDITHELLSSILERFIGEIEAHNKESSPIDAIHYANQRMAALYAANPGAMRCLLEAHADVAPFGRMWRKLTLEWNERIAQSIARQFPSAFSSPADYLTVAYSLAGAADSVLYEYYVLRNPAMRAAHPSDEDIARLLTTLWFRTLYLKNPPAGFLGQRLTGFLGLGTTLIDHEKSPRTKLPVPARRKPAERR